MNRYLKEDGTLNEERLWRDANAITDGASNPVGVCNSLVEMMTAVSRNQTRSNEINAQHAILGVFDHLHLLLTGCNSSDIKSEVYGTIMDRVEGK